MRTPVTRRRASTLLLASMAVSALAACGTATAPGLETPTPASTGSASSSSSSGGQSSSPSTSQSSGSSSSADTGGASGAAFCSASGTNYGPQYSASAALKSYGTTATVNDSFSRSVEVSVQAPRVVSSPAESAPSSGNEYIAIDVRAHLAKGSSFYFSYIEFSLFDPAHNACDTKSFSNVLPTPKMLNGVSMGASAKDAAGAIVYEVKAGADLSKLIVLFTSTSSDPASVGWKS